MSDDKPKLVYVDENAGFIERLGAVVANTASLQATTIVIGKAPPKNVTIAFDEKKKPPKTIEINPSYLRIVEIVAILTAFMLAVYAAMAVWGPDTDAVHKVSETFSHLATMGFGALVGLIGGKTGDKSDPK